MRYFNLKRACFPDTNSRVKDRTLRGLLLTHFRRKPHTRTSRNAICRYIIANERSYKFSPLPCPKPPTREYSHLYIDANVTRRFTRVHLIILFTRINYRNVIARSLVIRMLDYTCNLSKLNSPTQSCIQRDVSGYIEFQVYRTRCCGSRVYFEIAHVLRSFRITGDLFAPVKA